MMDIERLERRVRELEECFEAQTGVINFLLETCVDPEFISKLDKLAKYGKGKKKASE